MREVLLVTAGIVSIFLIVLIIPLAISQTNWQIAIKNQEGNPVATARIEEVGSPQNARYNVYITSTSGDFIFDEINMTGVTFSNVPIGISIANLGYHTITDKLNWGDTVTTEIKSATHLFGFLGNLSFEKATIKVVKNHWIRTVTKKNESTGELYEAKGTFYEDILHLSRCSEWDLISWNCSGKFEKQDTAFEDFGSYIIFEVDSFSGWTGTSYMYDDFEADDEDDYCTGDPPAGSNPWTINFCDQESGSFTLLTDTSACYMGSKCGELTSLSTEDPTKEQVEVVKNYGNASTKDNIYARVYFNVSCENPINIPDGAGDFWNLMMTGNPNNKPITVLGFNKDERLSCGGYDPGIFACSGQIAQTINCGEWYYAEMYYDSINKSLTCWLRIPDNFYHPFRTTSTTYSAKL